MAISGQHLHGLVPGDGPYLHHIQVGVLKQQAAGGFMPQSVEVEAINWGRFAEPLHDLDDVRMALWHRS